MDLRGVGMAAVAALVLIACPNAQEGDGGDSSGSSGAAGPCEPGNEIECACPDGSTGMQTCNAEGTGYDACSCGGASTTGSPTSGSPSPSTTGASASVSGADASATDGSSTSGGLICTPGEFEACDNCQADGPGYRECAADGESFGACLCCMGSHPIVEGDLRFCEPGFCYCGDLQQEPPIDVCLDVAVADVCCPVLLGDCN